MPVLPCHRRPFASSFLGGKDHGIGSVVTLVRDPKADVLLSFDLIVATAPLVAKACVSCGVEKALTEFHGHKVGKDGRRPRCKDCTPTEDPGRSAPTRDDASYTPDQ
jgi:hypothetical protein